MIHADDVRTLDALAAELAAMTTTMDVSFHPVTVFQLIGLLQLAQRHPDLSADLSAAATRFVTAAREYFAACPTILAVIARGADPREDR